MRAAWYDERGPAAEVLRVGELDAPEPRPGEVLVRVHASGINPGDTKKRSGYFDSPMAYPRIVPHGDGAGVVEAVGDGVPASRVGERVWVYGAQWYRPSGTAAELTTVPQEQAVRLPDATSFELGACLGIPGLTSHRAVFADGPVRDRTVLVVGAAGSVGSFAATLAAADGAVVVGVVRKDADVDAVRRTGAAHVLVEGRDDLAAEVRRLAPDGVDRVVDLALSANIDLYAEVLAVDGVIATYFSPAPTPAIPYFPLLFSNAVIRFVGSDDIPVAAKQQAARDITAALEQGRIDVPIGPTHDLADVARAHEAVEAGAAGGRVVVLPRPAS